VPVGVDHVLGGEDAVGDDEVADEGFEVGHRDRVRGRWANLYIRRGCAGQARL
jgi:hypothetical protein